MRVVYPTPYYYVCRAAGVRSDHGDPPGFPWPRYHVETGNDVQFEEGRQAGRAQRETLRRDGPLLYTTVSLSKTGYGATAHNLVPAGPSSCTAFCRAPSSWGERSHDEARSLSVPCRRASEMTGPRLGADPASGHCRWSSRPASTATKVGRPGKDGRRWSSRVTPLTAMRQVHRLCSVVYYVSCVASLSHGRRMGWRGLLPSRGWTRSAPRTLLQNAA